MSIMQQQDTKMEKLAAEFSSEAEALYWAQGLVEEFRIDMELASGL